MTCLLFPPGDKEDTQIIAFLMKVASPTVERGKTGLLKSGFLSKGRAMMLPFLLPFSVGFLRQAFQIRSFCNRCERIVTQGSECNRRVYGMIKKFHKRSIFLGLILLAQALHIARVIIG